MDVKYINPFIAASRRVLHQLLGVEPNVGTPKLMDNTISGSDIVVIVGLTGEIKGQVMFTMDESTAIQVARKMTLNPNLKELDVIAQSAISEMGNMISGSTGMEMYSGGISIDITPPSLCKGEGIMISSKNRFISIPLSLDNIGNIYINISFEQVEP